MQNQIIAAADGSALGNPGPAGWAWYIDDNHWAAGGWEHGTNNMGEIKAVLDLFEATAHRAESKLLVYCDSQYVINSLTQWMPGWKKRGWKKADGKPVQNRDLLEALDAATAGRDYEMVWVKGHAGHELNEAADSRANAAAQAFKEGQEPETGPGFPGSPHSSAAQTSPQAPQTDDAPARTPQTAPLSETGAPDTLVTDAHLSLEDFTETEVERARQGFDSLKLNGILKPASAVTAPDPQAVQERKTKLAEASARAAEREAQAQQRALAEQELAESEAEQNEEFDGEDFEEFEETNRGGVPAQSTTVSAASEESVPDEAAPTETAAPAAPNPEDAVRAERELEARGGRMSDAEISALLNERLVWVTATGRSVSRADTIAYRARAFTQQGEPVKQGVQVVDNNNVLIMAAVQTARGRVNRSSLWHYDPQSSSNGWRLRFRQETAAS